MVPMTVPHVAPVTPSAGCPAKRRLRRKFEEGIDGGDAGLCGGVWAEDEECVGEDVDEVRGDDGDEDDHRLMHAVEVLGDGAGPEGDDGSADEDSGVLGFEFDESRVVVGEVLEGEADDGGEGEHDDEPGEEAHPESCPGVGWGAVSALCAEVL